MKKKKETWVHNTTPLTPAAVSRTFYPYIVQTNTTTIWVALKSSFILYFLHLVFLCICLSVFFLSTRTGRHRMYAYLLKTHFNLRKTLLMREINLHIYSRNLECDDDDTMDSSKKSLKMENFSFQFWYHCIFAWLRLHCIIKGNF